jgi:putative DNA methylase
LKRKLIEVSLPLEAINAASAREKSIRHGHPSTLHLWWARRPLAAARAVLFAQLVDDPSAHPEEFATEEEQRVERERLHGIIERLVDWDNVRDEKLLAEAYEEILRSTSGNPPPILDPFAGGGTIPLEAQRLGLEARASDLNPVAVLINKALIEIPPNFRDQPPTFPGLAGSEIREWKGAAGLAADVRSYSEWLLGEAEARIGDLYPPVKLPDGSSLPVIAWLWARTVRCPNPACGISMPLVRTWWLGKKQGKEAFVRATIVADAVDPSGQRVDFEVRYGPSGPRGRQDGTVGRTGATCIACVTGVDLKYVRLESAAGRMGQQLMALVVEGARSRQYVTPDREQLEAPIVRRPPGLSDAPLPAQALGFRVQAYGMTRWTDLFTNRQLVALTTLIDLAKEARDKACADGAEPEYADAIATYLALSVSRMVDRHSSLTTWDNGPKKEYERSVFSRHAVQMSWDFVESNPLTSPGAGLSASVSWLASALERLPASKPGVVTSADAAALNYDGVLVSTDPPYYDNIGYADLSDFFYFWLRRALRSIYPDLFSTVVVPKLEELVAEPFRHGGKDGARAFFEAGFRSVFARARAAARGDFPITVWYAFKQSESDEQGEASTGWETLLEGMIRSGWEITATWPVRSEMGNRVRSIGSNALATSIVLALRPRSDDAAIVDRRGYIDLLREELPTKLRELQQGAIAPVDLAQAAIGPGMAVFSRFSRVVEPNGTNVTVREALRLVNTVLGEVLSDQEGDFDTDTRWCVKWFETHGFDKAAYGEAETLASAYNTSMAGLDRSGAVSAKGGEVRLLTTAELQKAYRPERDEHITLWEVAMHLVKALDESGLGEAGRILTGASERVAPEGVKELAYLVFSLAEKRSMTQVAGMFNALVTSWPEVTSAAKAYANAVPRAAEQTMLVLDDDLNG